MRGPDPACAGITRAGLNDGNKDNRGMTIQSAVRKAALHASEGKASDDLRYWLSQPVQARLAAVEELRRQTPGYDAQPRLQRVCRIIRLKPA